MGQSIAKAIGLSTALLLAACAAPSQTPAPTVAPSNNNAGLTLPEGYAASLLVDGLRNPTAMAFGAAPDPLTGGSRRLYVAQLNGGENDGTGQIIAIEAGRNITSVVAEGLMKPTGLAWFNDALYVVAYRSVLMLNADNGRLSPPKTLIADVPFNGRSLGRVKVGPSPDPFTGEAEPRLYFQSTGGGAGTSGFVYSMRLDGSDMRTIARGLKNAFAFTWSLGDGTMYATEIGDSLGAPPVEEVNVMQRDGDYGWPSCAAGIACGNTSAPLATFAPHATPTGSAWWEDKLIITLFGPTDPHVAQIELTKANAVSDFARGLQNPIDALVTNEGTLLIMDFAGSVYEIRRLQPTANALPQPRPSPTPKTP